MLSKKKKTAMTVGITAITLLVVFPFVWMILLSFKTNSVKLSILVSMSFG